MSEQVLNTLGIEKWDEVNGASPSISKDPMRGIEDMIEQNDNQLDGIINNIENSQPIGIKNLEETEKHSVLEKIKIQTLEDEITEAVLRQRKPVVPCCLEREVL